MSNLFISNLQRILTLVSIFSLFTTLSSPIVSANEYENPKVQLITVSCDATCNTEKGLDWSKAKISNNGKYSQMNCGDATFEGKIINGITDYADGISVNFLENNPIKSLTNNISYKLNPHAGRISMRNCAYYWQKSGNSKYYNPCLETATYTDIVKTGQEIMPRLDNNKEIPALDCSTASPAINNSASSNPIFAYQFQYNINFDQSNRENQSKVYSQMTGTTGVYDGVKMTYTYYSFQKNGTWEKWQNPNVGNIYGGWLIYPIIDKTLVDIRQNI